MEVQNIVSIHNIDSQFMHAGNAGSCGPAFLARIN